MLVRIVRCRASFEHHHHSIDAKSVSVDLLQLSHVLIVLQNQSAFNVSALM